MNALAGVRGTAVLLLALAACGEPSGQQTQSLEGVVDTLAQEPDTGGAPDPDALSDTSAGPAGADAAPPALIPEDLAAGAPWTAGAVSSPSTVTGTVPLLTAIRTGRHEAFDRVAFELGDPGAGVPAYHVGWIDRPVHACGSGEEVFPAGEGWLEVRMEPLNAHTEQGEPTVPHRPQDMDGLQNLLRVYLTCDFEAVVTIVLAARSPDEFRVFELEEPRRIVVDVRH